MSRSTVRLSDIARRLAVPSGIVASAWPATAAKLNDLGLRFDPWQVQLARLALAKRADGLFAAGVGGIAWSMPRQVGKTFTLAGLAMAQCLLRPGLMVLWTAHQLKTSDQTFRAMLGMRSRPQVKPYTLRPSLENGDQEIPFANGSRILFGARERGFGLGFARVGIVILDEAQRLTVKALDDMVPTTNQAENPLIFLTGTPPRPTDPGEEFTRRRADALSPDPDPDAAWVEFGADPLTDPSVWGPGRVDWEQVAAANPSFPHRTPKSSVLRMLKLLGPESFKREGLGLWDMDAPPEPPLIPPKVWADAVGVKPGQGAVAWAVRFSPDGRTVALAGAIRPDDGPVFVEVVDERDVAEGLEWIAAWLGQRWRSASQIVLDGKAGVGALVPALRAVGVGSQRVMVARWGQVADAHALFLARLLAGGVAHSSQPGLDAQVADGARRMVGVSGGWAWRSLSGENRMTGLEAATLAVWSVLTTRRRPDRKGGGVL